MATATTHHHRRKPDHRRDLSGELDVFEAANYLSGCNDTVGFSGKPLKMSVPPATATTGQEQGKFGAEHEISSKHCDYPKVELKLSTEHGFSARKGTEVEYWNKKQKPKQPVTPSARLAGFLSSLFLHSSQQSTRKKKPTPAAPERERGRRNSVSHIQQTRPQVPEHRVQPKTLHTCKSTGNRTPPHPNQKKSFSTSKSLASYPAGDYAYGSSRKPADGSSVNERLRGVGELHWGKIRAAVENGSRVHVGELLQGDCCAGLSPMEEKKWTLNKDSKGLVALGGDDELEDLYYGRRQRQAFWRREEAEDSGAESDSSSDLFELRTYDVCACKVVGDLPVYRTTIAK